LQRQTRTKPDLDLERFLRELTADLIVLREPKSANRIKTWVKELGLYQACVATNIWVIGKDKTVVSTEAKRIELEIAEKKAAVRNSRLESFEQKREQLIEMGDGGNVSGKWILDMPEYDKQHREGKGHEDGECSMDIAAYQENDESLRGKLDILAFQGWFDGSFRGQCGINQI
jgi:hypothetical protein